VAFLAVVSLRTCGVLVVAWVHPGGLCWLSMSSVTNWTW
jgi:hypothetical protein